MTLLGTLCERKQKAPGSLSAETANRRRLGGNLKDGDRSVVEQSDEVAVDLPASDEFLCLLTD
jgi:hypothetical protein